MTLAVPPEKVEAFLDLSRRREVEATVLGEFTDSGYLHVTYGDETAAYLSMDFLHEGAPVLRLEARWQPPSHAEPSSDGRPEPERALRDLLGRLNLCSGEAKARHYDHEVKGLTVVKPFVGAGCDVPAEATVFLVRHGSRRGYVLSEGVNPFYSDIDTYAMAAACVDEAVRRQVCAGARLDRIALLDNFCWPDPVESDSTPDGAYKMAQLVRACRGLHDACVAYGAPLISGKDSMKNDSSMGGVKISVPPTLLVSALGQIDDVEQSVTLDLKQDGDAVFILGTTRDETGGSEYFRYLGETHGLLRAPGQPAPYVGMNVPRLVPLETVRLYRTLEVAIREGLVRSAATASRGGLGVAFARCAMAGALGAEIDLDGCSDLAALPLDVALFSESCGRFIVTTSEADASRFEPLFKGRPCRRVGKVTSKPKLIIRVRGRAAIDVPVDDLRARFKGTLADV
jgi:phosphoribosylformylglycinamidine synthase